MDAATVFWIASMTKADRLGRPPCSWWSAAKPTLDR